MNCWGVTKCVCVVLCTLRVRLCMETLWNCIIGFSNCDMPIPYLHYYISYVSKNHPKKISRLSTSEELCVETNTYVNL